MSSDLSGFIWLAALLVSNAFFVGSEFAVISARRAQIEPLADKGNPAAKITLKAMEKCTTAKLRVFGICVGRDSLRCSPRSALGLDVRRCGARQERLGDFRQVLA